MELFWLITKNWINKELKKISNNFNLTNKDISNNKNNINSNSLKIARLEGVISMLIREKSPVSVSKGLKKSQAISSTIETKIVNRVRRNKKALVIAEINKLSPSLSVIEMFEDIVLTKGLCSKASFYRYVSSLKSQNLLETKTELRH